MPSSNWTRWLYVSLTVVVIDQLSKKIIGNAFALGDSLTITPFFNLVLAYNTGAAFSFLADGGGWQRFLFMTIALVASVVIASLLRKHRGNPLFSLALALILGGAIGNLVDRTLLGHVIDFVQLHAAGYYFPAFNVADSAITVGAALLIWDSFRARAAKQVI
jgi:signal peptidase II